MEYLLCGECADLYRLENQKKHEDTQANNKDNFGIVFQIIIKWIWFI
jgi:hypothetical protein